MYDIAVIGGGPAGLSAAIQARARNKSVLVVSGDDRDNPLYLSLIHISEPTRRS